MKDELDKAVQAEYIVVKALGPGVSVSGLTRGEETRFLHSEKLDPGEVFIAQFTENVSVMKIRGQAEILTRFGRVFSGTTDVRADQLMGQEEEHTEAPEFEV